MAMSMANICCSFELEPRTLSQGQLNQAREVAAGVAQSLESREASALFNEGMIENIKEVKQRERGENGGQEEKGGDDGVGEDKGKQCLCRTVESMGEQTNLKEPLSAPF